MNHEDALTGIYSDLIAVGLMTPETSGTFKVFDLPADRAFTTGNIAGAIADGTVRWTSPLVRLIVEDRVLAIIDHLTGPQGDRPPS